MLKLTKASAVRAAFWRESGASRKRIRSYDGKGWMYCTDTRVAFVDFIDAEHRSGRISDALARTVTLGGAQ